MSDWKKGDLAELVSRNYFRCGHGIGWDPVDLSKMRYQTVVDVKPCRAYAGNACGCVGLVLSDGSFGHSSRFRKVTPPKADEFDQEIIVLMASKKIPERTPQ